MDEDQEVVPEAETEVEVVVPETPEPEVPAEPEVDWKSEAEKAKELASNYKIRAEKAEKKVKEAPVASPDAPMSVADAAALIKQDVHEDDYGEVEKFAKYKGLTVRDALKTDELKAILGVYSEKRSTANAANVTNVRRGSVKISDDALVSNASRGKLPDSDDEIDQLMAAKYRQK